MNLEILDLIRKRLLVGEKKYGHENIINDGRDFTQEALEESLDMAVYVAAKLIETKQKEKQQMGRAIEHENKIARIEKKQELSDGVQEDQLLMINQILKRLDNLEENNTQVHHVDLTEDVTSETTPTIKGTTLEPDEEYTAPVGKRKKTTKTKTATVG